MVANLQNLAAPGVIERAINVVRPRAMCDDFYLRLPSQVRFDEFLGNIVHQSRQAYTVQYSFRARRH